MPREIHSIGFKVCVQRGIVLFIYYCSDVILQSGRQVLDPDGMWESANIFLTFPVS